MSKPTEVPILPDTDHGYTDTISIRGMSVDWDEAWGLVQDCVFYPEHIRPLIFGARVAKYQCDCKTAFDVDDIRAMCAHILKTLGGTSHRLIWGHEYAA